MGNLFNLLIEGLGSILGFFYDLLDGLPSEGWALGLSIILLTIVVNLLVFPANAQADPGHQGLHRDPT